MDQAGPSRGDEPSPDAKNGPASSLTVTDGEPAGAAIQPGDAKPGRSASRAGRWLHAAFTRQVAVLAGFLAAGIAFTWPRASYLWDHQLPGTRDSASFVWGFWWVGRQVTHLANPWFTRYIAAPVGTQLGFHTLMPLPGLVLTPLTLAFGPSASYNLLSALTPGLVAYAMYRLARLWVRSQVGAVAAGAFFGLSCMLTFDSWYLVNLALGAAFIPLALEAAVRLRRRPGWRPALYLGVVAGACLLTDQESFILAVIAAALALVPWVLFGPRGQGRTWQEGLQARLWPAALAVLVALVVGSPQIIAMFQEVAAGSGSVNPNLFAGSYLTYAVGLLGLFAPTPHVAEFGLHTLASLYYTHGIAGPHSPLLANLTGLQAPDTPAFGFVVPALALAGLVVSWRRRSAWLLALLLAGCAAMALGTVLWVGNRSFVPLAQEWDGLRVSALMPYTWLIRIPGLSSFREADRFVELGLVAAALLAGSAVDWLRYHARPLMVVALAASVLELGWAGNPPAGVMPAAWQVGIMPTSMPGLDGRIAADRSSSVVVDFPFGIRGGFPLYGQAFQPESELLATADGHPLGDALISRPPSATISGITGHPFYAGLVDVFHRPVQVLHARAFPQAAADARRMDVGWVIVWPTHLRHTIAHYLTLTGFTVDYRAGSVVVWHRAGSR